MLTFTVYGVAQPKGSTRAFLPNGARYPIVTADNPKTKGWQQVVAEGASAALQRRPVDQRRLLLGGVILGATFYLPRPKSLPKTVSEHLKKPDLDKLLRSVKDALTGVLWRDDAQVVTVRAEKHYAAHDEPPHVDLVIASVEDASRHVG